jgi:hypothetical protein
VEKAATQRLFEMNYILLSHQVVNGIFYHALLVFQFL